MYILYWLLLLILVEPKDPTPFQLIIMRLQLSLAAQDLPTTRRGVFAVVVDTGHDGQLMGQTEVLMTTNDQAADWTKLFYIDDWELGQSQEFVVTLYTGKECLGSVLLEVGAVLGAPRQPFGPKNEERECRRGARRRSHGNRDVAISITRLESCESGSRIGYSQ